MSTILLIENNSEILENFTEYFEIEGFKILATINGRIGVEMAREFTPDLIISEILLGGMNGYHVLRLLLNTTRTSGIPFIFSTTKCEITDRTLAMSLGADDFIVKPFNMELLTQMARKWIGCGSKRYKN